MHPPRFLHTHLLADWPECHIEVRCRRCGGRSASYAVKGLLRWYGNIAFASLFKRLKCKLCLGRPSAVYLCASPQRTASDGSAPDWAVEIARDRDYAFARS